MKTWFSYTFKLDHVLPSFSFSMCVGVGENILEEGRHHMRKILTEKLEGMVDSGEISHTPEENKDWISSMMKSTVELLEVKEIEGCMGCCYEKLGQQAHMECPNGCLHDPKTCDLCIMCD